MVDGRVKEFYNRIEAKIELQIKEIYGTSILAERS